MIDIIGFWLAFSMLTLFIFYWTIPVFSGILNHLYSKIGVEGDMPWGQKYLFRSAKYCCGYAEGSSSILFNRFEVHDALICLPSLLGGILFTIIAIGGVRIEGIELCRLDILIAISTYLTSPALVLGSFCVVYLGIIKVGKLILKVNKAMEKLND